MNAHHVLRATALAVLLSSGIRLCAQPASPDNQRELDARLRALDLLDQAARTSADREHAQKQAALSAATYDLNHDGKLDAPEFAAYEKAVRTAVSQSRKLLKRFDRNHDNVLDDAEWAAARQEIFTN